MIEIVAKTLSTFSPVCRQWAGLLATVWPLLAANLGAQVLSNGANHDGTVVVNGTNTHTFSATTGDTIILRCGELSGSASFAPWLRLYGPTSALLSSDAQANDAYITYRATNTGTFTVTVNSTGTGQNGTYRLRFFKIPGAFTVPAGDDGGSLTNGANQDGVSELGDEDAWTFSANARDSVILRCARLTGAGLNGYFPYLRLYGPDGALLDTDTNDKDSYIAYRTTNSGVFTVVVGSYYRGDTGTYRLRFVQVPGAFVVPAGDEGGPLTNGANHSGTNDLGDEDIWTFTANAKDSIILRCGELAGAGLNGYFAYLRLYGPDGALLVVDANSTDSYISYQTTNSGTFTVVVGSYYRGDSGAYRLRFLKIPGAFVVPPGDEGGVLTNGANHDGTTELGDEDAWTFTANAKESIILRCGELTGSGLNGYFSHLRLYGPDGALLVVDANSTDSYIAYRTTNSGVFTVVVGSAYRGETGMYRLRFLKIPGAFVVPPGDEGGVLTNGANHDGTNDLGDEDIWTFTANASDSIVLRCGELTGAGPNGYYPYLRLYGPDGALLDEDNNPTDTYVSYRTTNSGTFSVVVGSAYRGDTGSYRLRFMHVPGAFVVPLGDDGGALTNGANHDGTTGLGDEDIWTFTANAKDNIILRCGELSAAGANGYYPYLRLYGPDGALLAAVLNASDSYLAYQTTNSGTFSVLVGSGYRGDTGTYRLRFFKTPGAFVVPAGDEGGLLTNGANHDGVTALGDEDIWTFTANAKDSFVLRCGQLSGAGPNGYYPYLRLYGPDGALLDADTHASDSFLAYQATNSGTFTVIVGSYYGGDTGTYRLTLAKMPGTFAISAGDQGGSLTNGANHDGEITVGDEDMWRFTACSGAQISLSCAELTGSSTFYPWIRLYGPDGAFLVHATGASLATINYQTTNRGAFTLLVGSYYRAETGTYRLTSNGLSDGLKACLPILAGTNIILSGIGGQSNATYIVYSATNISTSAPAWTPIRTNTLDPFGTFVFTNVWNRAEAQRYFRLLHQ